MTKHRDTDELAALLRQARDNKPAAPTKPKPKRGLYLPLLQKQRNGGKRPPPRVHTQRGRRGRP